MVRVRRTWATIATVLGLGFLASAAYGLVTGTIIAVFVGELLCSLALLWLGRRLAPPT